MWLALKTDSISVVEQNLVEAIRRRCSGDEINLTYHRDAANQYESLTKSHEMTSKLLVDHMH